MFQFLKMKYIVLGILFYLIYKVIFRFIIPVYKTTKQVRQQFVDMQQKVQEQFNQQNHYQTSPQTEEQPKKVVKDYIDFEDVK